MNVETLLVGSTTVGTADCRWVINQLELSENGYILTVRLVDDEVEVGVAVEVEVEVTAGGVEVEVGVSLLLVALVVGVVDVSRGSEVLSGVFELVLAGA